VRDSIILWEQPEGLPYLVAHNPATGAMAAGPAPPEWASPELADAVTGSLRALVDGYCIRCEAIGQPPDPAVPARRATLGHAPWCPWSGESIERLIKACQPPGRRWIADTSDDCIERLGDYVSALAASLLRDAG
jgi:hypothetical protein